MTTKYDHLGRSGVFSRAEALDWGESDKSLARARQAGVIVRLRRGMYVAAATYNDCDESGKHLLRARAALLAQQGEAILTGASAAALHGFALHDQDLSDVHLLRLDTVARRIIAAGANHHVRDVAGHGEARSRSSTASASSQRRVRCGRSRAGPVWRAVW